MTLPKQSSHDRRLYVTLTIGPADDSNIRHLPGETAPGSFWPGAEAVVPGTRRPQVSWTILRQDEPEGAEESLRQLRLVFPADPRTLIEHLDGDVLRESTGGRWREYPIRVRRIIADEAVRAETEGAMRKMRGEVCIEAEVDVITATDSPLAIISVRSARSGVCFIGLSLDGPAGEENRSRPSSRWSPRARASSSSPRAGTICIRRTDRRAKSLVGLRHGSPTHQGMMPGSVSVKFTKDGGCGESCDAPA